ncbi:MAG: ABC transporter ATP-binding protein [Clostridia bacterium]|nr:ABC transporter ATP-binding protein [Clostridia bacterium]
MIELRGVSKRFGTKRILDGVGLRLDVPGMAALTGASGAGKTTVGRMLLGLDVDYEGEIRGVPDSRACVFQEDRLLPQLTAAQNVQFVRPELTREQMGEAFAALGLRGEVDSRVSELSGGMRRRVSILRALLSGASFVVMDEPMKGLDAPIAREAARYIREAMRGRTLLYITHALEEIEWMGISTVLRVENGSIRRT